MPACLGQVSKDALGFLREQFGKEVRFDLGGLLVDSVVPLDTPVRLQDDDFVAVLRGRDVCLTILPPKNSDPELELIPLPLSDGNSVALPQLGPGVSRHATLRITEGREYRLLLHWKGRADRDVLLRLRPSDPESTPIPKEPPLRLAIGESVVDPWTRPEIEWQDGHPVSVAAPGWYPVQCTPWFGAYGAGSPARPEVVSVERLGQRIAELLRTDCWRLDLEFHAEGSVRLLRASLRPAPPEPQVPLEPKRRSPSAHERSLTICTDERIRVALAEAPSLPRRPSKLFVRNLLHLDEAADGELVQALTARARRIKKELPKRKVARVQSDEAVDAPAEAEPTPVPSSSLSYQEIESKVKSWGKPIPKHVSVRLARQILRLQESERVPQDSMSRYRNLIRRAARSLPKVSKEPVSIRPAEVRPTADVGPARKAGNIEGLARRRVALANLRRGHGPAFVKELERLRRDRYLAERAAHDGLALLAMKDELRALDPSERPSRIRAKMGLTAQQLAWLCSSRPDLVWVRE